MWSLDEPKDNGEALAVALLLEAGRLMEDSSPEFALVMPDPQAIVARADLLDQIPFDFVRFGSIGLITESQPRIRLLP